MRHYSAGYADGPGAQTVALRVTDVIVLVGLAISHLVYVHLALDVWVLVSQIIKDV
jgi:hypothetical protein